MKWWRAGVAVAALLLVVIAASGTSPVTFVNRLDDSRPPPQDSVAQPEIPLPTELPGALTVSLTAYLVVLAGLVLFGLVGIILAIELPRWRRRGARGVEIEEGEAGEMAVVRRVEKALQEFTAHPNRPPRDAVIAAWVALEAAEERLPHQTPTEFTEKLGVDALVLKDLYQRVRFGHEDVTAAQAERARDELSRIVRELA